MPRQTLDNGSSNAMSFRQVDADSWADFETLFERPGAPKYCWCMVWRAVGEERKHRDGRSRKSYMRRRVGEGVPVGIVGYIDGRPVAWCSIAPRSSYRPLGRIEDPDRDARKVWSLACFYVLRRLRGQGIARRMLTAAVDYARREGAGVVEAYPVDPDSPSYRFMGYVDLFADEGFREAGRAGTRRHIMRRELRPRKKNSK
jgi:GNAT superfamily N-acetyltransferase